MFWNLNQKKRRPGGEEVAEVWSFTLYIGCVLTIILFPFSIIGFLSMIVLSILLGLSDKCFGWPSKSNLDHMPAWLRRLIWMIAAPPDLTGNDILIYRDGLQVATLKMRYRTFSCVSSRDVRIIWHPELPILAVGVMDDIYFDMIMLDLRHGEQFGSAIGLENFYSWKGGRMIAHGFQEKSSIAPKPEDRELVEWVTSVIDDPRKKWHQEKPVKSVTDV